MRKFALCIMFLLLAAHAAFAAAAVQQVSGKAEIFKAASGEWQPAKVGDTVNPGDKVKVENGQAIVTSSGGNVKVSAGKNTTVSYAGAEKDTDKYNLENGRIWVNVKKGTKVTTESPVQVASVRGTEYSQGYNAETGTGSTSVTDGTVETTDKTTGETSTLTAGQSNNVVGSPTAQTVSQGTGQQGETNAPVSYASDTSASGGGGGAAGEGRERQQDCSSQQPGGSSDTPGGGGASPT